MEPARTHIKNDNEAQLTITYQQVAVIFLEELNILYEHKMLYLAEGNEDYKKRFINGKVPVIEDPNTGVVLWKSGAIIE